MTEVKAALTSAHRANLRRYCRLLATNLTDLERDFVHRRIAETRRLLDQLEAETTASQHQPEAELTAMAA
jgi:hypothetical protein